MGYFWGIFFKKLPTTAKPKRTFSSRKSSVFCAKWTSKKLEKSLKIDPKTPPVPFLSWTSLPPPPPPSSKWAGRLFSPFETPGHHGAPFGPKKGHYYIIWTYTTTYCSTSCKEIHLISVYRTLIFEVLVGKMRLIFANILVRYNPR